MNESRRLGAVQAPIIPVIAELIRAHPATISLGQGVVSYAPPPGVVDRVARFFAEPALNKYQAVGGLPPLVAALAEKLRVENSIVIDPADPHGVQLMVTAGGNNAFMAVLLAIADPGDEVILPTPYYFNHEMAITMANCRPVLVPTDATYQLDLDALRSAITPRTRAIVTVSPNNPTGAVYSEASLRAVNALCAERGLFHISDEAYEYFTYDGAAHFSPGSLPGAAAHTISLFSLSKSYGFASWRIGWMVFPARLGSALRKIQDTLLICPPVISQVAALGALDRDAGGGTPFVRAQLAALTEVRMLVSTVLGSLAAEGCCVVPRAQGAFYFFLRVRTNLASFELAQRLIREHGVAAIPGSAFGLAPEAGCYLRVAYGALQRETAAGGMTRLSAGLRALASQ